MRFALEQRKTRGFPPLVQYLVQGITNPLLSALTGPLYKHSQKLDVDSLYAGMEEAFSSYLRQVEATVIECSGVSLSAPSSSTT